MLGAGYLFVSNSLKGFFFSFFPTLSHTQHNVLLLWTEKKNNKQTSRRNQESRKKFVTDISTKRKLALRPKNGGQHETLNVTRLGCSSDFYFQQLILWLIRTELNIGKVQFNLLAARAKRALIDSNRRWLATHVSHDPKFMLKKDEKIYRLRKANELTGRRFAFFDV